MVVCDYEVEQLYVTSTKRGTGVADKLMGAAEDQIVRHHGVPWLSVVAGNSRARRFYERCGWRDTGPFDNLAEITGGAVMAVPSRHRATVNKGAGDDDGC